MVHASINVLVFGFVLDGQLSAVKLFLEFLKLEENRMSAKWVICFKSSNSRYALVENNKISFNLNSKISRFLWKLKLFISNDFIILIGHFLCPAEAYRSFETWSESL